MTGAVEHECIIDVALATITRNAMSIRRIDSHHEFLMRGQRPLHTLARDSSLGLGYNFHNLRGCSRSTGVSSLTRHDENFADQIRVTSIGEKIDRPVYEGLNTTVNLIPHCNFNQSKNSSENK